MRKADKFHQHEALHMALFLGESVSKQLLNNAFIQENPECEKLARTATEALLDLYQMVGSVEDE